MNALVNRKLVLKESGDFTHYTSKVHFNGVLTIENAIGEGAPNTDSYAWESVTSIDKRLLVADRPLIEYRNFLMVSFGRFMHEVAVLKWVEKSGLENRFAHPRLILAFAKDNPNFCIEAKQRYSGLVTFVPKVRHLAQSHVLVLYYKENPPDIKRSLRLDPYAGGWAAHHWFCFELPATPAIR